MTSARLSADLAAYVDAGVAAGYSRSEVIARCVRLAKAVSLAAARGNPYAVELVERVTGRTPEGRDDE